MNAILSRLLCTEPKLIDLQTGQLETRVRVIKVSLYVLKYDKSLGKTGIHVSKHVSRLFVLYIRFSLQLMFNLFVVNVKETRTLDTIKIIYVHIYCRV